MSHSLQGALTEQQGLLPPEAFAERVGSHALGDDAQEERQDLEDADAPVAPSS